MVGKLEVKHALKTYNTQRDVIYLGYGNSIDLRHLKKGGYYVNFNNETPKVRVR